ncbi:MAG: hypothetical protein FJW27_17710 [Acidimicrobiia bacterium]|nr:hypothetical protein [Acidimicrobiia bacterium]
MGTPLNTPEFQPRAPRQGVAVFVLLLVAGVLMLPRLRSPQLGLFDDGVVLQLAEGMPKDWSVAIELTRNTGRFMPGYWLFYGMRHMLFGVHPLALFLINWLVLVVTTICLVRFVRLAGGSRRASFAAGLLFVLCGPVIEHFYTLTKSEVPLTLWLAAALPLVAASPRLWGAGRRAAARLGLLFVFVLMACLTKETAVVLVPISASWFLLQRLRGDVEKWESGSPGYGSTCSLASSASASSSACGGISQCRPSRRASTREPIVLRWARY